MIEFHDVSVCYEPNKRHPVRSLDGLSLQIARGDWVFLVGPSGAGKSSLLKLIYAGTSAQSGRITVDGQDITQIARSEIPALRRKIGIVFQDFQLLNEKTAWENVAFTLRVIGAPQSVIVREVPRALETVGLTHRAEAFPHELSGGEQQRIAVARAIVNDPKILLADEPTGNLDPKTAREIGELLTKINFERGTTIVMATHDRSFVNELQRRVVRLKMGQVVSDENPGAYGEADQGAEETAPFQTSPPRLAPQVTPPDIETPRLETPAAVEPVALPVAMREEKAIESEKILTFSSQWEKIAEKPPEVAAETVASPEKPVAREQKLVQMERQPVQIPEIAPAPAQKTPALPIVSAPVVSAPVASAPVVSAPVVSAPVVSAPVVSAPPPQTSPAPVASAPPKTPIPPSAPVIAASSVSAPNTFSENTPIEDFPAPRPMARRIAPSNAPAPPPPSGHALDPNTQSADPNAPVGSPENPIVQYE